MIFDFQKFEVRNSKLKKGKPAYTPPYATIAAVSDPGKFQRVSRGEFFRICGEDTRSR